MVIRAYKAYTPGIRNRTVSQFKSILPLKGARKLISGQKRHQGRNHRGIITSRHRGGGHKRLYRHIDFKRNKRTIWGHIASIEYDPNRNARICLVNYEDGDRRYILHPRGLNLNDKIITSEKAPISPGNALPLTQMPLGTTVHNIELTPGKGAQLVRAAGTLAQLVAKEGKLATLRLPSGEVRLISQQCIATVGQVGHIEAKNRTFGKAGARRWLGKRPHVRGVVMNAVDHPHGGGEGKAPIGRQRPLTPWGRPALGRNSRRKHKYSDSLILRRRKDI